MLKKVFVFLMIIILSCIFCFSNVSARAGGGTSGGSSGGSSSSSLNTRKNGNSSGGSNNPVERLLSSMVLMLVGCSTIIVLKIRLNKAKVKTRKKFRKLKWNYKDTKKRIEEAYYVIQKAWANSDMSSAKEYMMQDLLDYFQMKLDWLDVADKKNIMYDIKLLDFYPISLTDCRGEKDDVIWVYIKGEMIDYTVDIEAGQLTDGEIESKVFIEFWQFKKNEVGKWVLNKILQENELDKVPLDE